MPGDEFELPRSFAVSDQLSLAGQRRFLLATRLQLWLVLAAGVGGAVTWRAGSVDLGALGAALAFLSAAMVRLLVQRTKPHRHWYEGRAAAESITSLAWRFSAGGHPFAAAIGPGADEQFEVHARDILGGLQSLKNLGLTTASYRPTASMAHLRARPLDERREAFRRGRIEDQRDWYRRKAQFNRRRTRAWSAALVTLQLAAAAGAFLVALNVIAIDLFGLAGAGFATGATWLETRQHANLANAYEVAADELGEIAGLISDARTEDDWARFVDDAEAAISREHTLWKVSSGRRQPANL